MMNKLTAIKIKNYSSEQTGIVTVHRPDSLKLILSLAICPLARVVWMAVLGGEIYAQDKALIISVPMTLTELLWRAHWAEDDGSQAAGIVASFKCGSCGGVQECEVGKPERCSVCGGSLYLFVGGKEPSNAL
jgi:hypothetical protein